MLINHVGLWDVTFNGFSKRSRNVVQDLLGPSSLVLEKVPGSIPTVVINNTEKRKCQYNDNQSPKDRSGGNFQNVVHIKYTLDNGQCQRNVFIMNQSLSQTFREYKKRWKDHPHLKDSEVGNKA
jgi:hypothetical protein